MTYGDHLVLKRFSLESGLTIHREQAVWITPGYEEEFTLVDALQCYDR